MSRRATERDLTGLQRRLGYTFRDLALLRRAVTHRSHAADHNERLEFIGDSLLNCVVAVLLFERLPGLPEGDLSRLRAGLVNQSALFEIAQGLELGDELLLGEGELKSGGFRRPSILADALEAILGAVYLDGGFEAVHAVIGRLFAARLDSAGTAPPGKDPKTALQELLQGRRLPLPRYTVLQVGGEAHQQTFRVECRVDELGIVQAGEGT
ncbi:MAG TPA: ribonuclease III, partial [Usitatibacteraceae bacterium]|nr:ribonuclease III [Usitatibacteraceae bacterium]